MPSKDTLNTSNLEALGTKRLVVLLTEVSKGNSVAQRRLRLELEGAASGDDVAREFDKRFSGYRMAMPLMAFGPWISAIIAGRKSRQFREAMPGHTGMDDSEKLRRYERAYVASMLGILPDVLDRSPYRIEHALGLGGSMPVWRVIWTREPPRGVEAQRSADMIWTDIPSLFNSDGSC